MEEVKTFKDFMLNESLLSQSRSVLRNIVLKINSMSKSIDQVDYWIRFPYYHHVFDDEKIGFERQLRYLRNFGEFISMDNACQLIRQSEPLNGRYFCLSFDDGFFNCYSNMMEITSSLSIPAIIYLPTDYIGLDLDREDDRRKILQFYPDRPKAVSFLSWENCNTMLSHNITFGSHTCSHANLARISRQSIEIEMQASKKLIESKLKARCDHFACPWGRMGIDFNPEVTTMLAIQSGYLSFSTTDRGKMERGSDPYLLKRDHLLANWENFQLKYFFSR